MGSTFIKSSKNKIRVPGIYKDIEIPFYMQFVPGVVTDVVTSTKHYAYGGSKRNINSILATKHVGKDLMDRKGSHLHEKYLDEYTSVISSKAKNKKQYKGEKNDN